MSTGSSIEWTEATWSPVAGCTRVSAGCDHCYAVAMTHRLEKMGQGKYAGLTVLNNHGDRHFNGQVRCVEEALEVPLKWKKPRRIFVNSMSDLFHRDVPENFIAKCFAIMGLASWHTFQLLTKRTERMEELLNDERFAEAVHVFGEEHSDYADAVAERYGLYDPCERVTTDWRAQDHTRLPLPNVWLGTSCEDQAAADARIPHLLKCPAAVRFISAEPLLGEVSLVNSGAFFPGACGCQEEEGRTPCAACRDTGAVSGVDWVIVGGESGKGARPCNVEWIRSIVRQCQEAGVACFVKQLGKVTYDGEVEYCRFTSYEQWVNKASSWLGGVNSAGQRYAPRANAVCLDGRGRICRIGADFMRARDEDAFSVHCHEVMKLSDPKGGDPAEWPEDLRVREWPAQKAGAA